MTIDFNNLSTILTAIGTVLAAIISGYMTIRKVIDGKKKARDRQALSILKSAKDEDSALKLHLESKIHEMEIKLNSLKENVDKDLSHLKETYNSELRFLGQKIEELRKEVHDQHGQLVQLLTKMIGKD